jgi:hypothetical protein
MSNRSDPAVPDAVVQSFDSDCIVLAIESILPVKAIEKTVKSSHKYRQIAASIAGMPATTAGREPGSSMSTKTSATRRSPTCEARSTFARLIC